MPQRKSSTTMQTGRKRSAAERTNYTDRNKETAAGQVKAFLDSEVIPSWLRESVEDALREAADRNAGIDSFRIVRNAAGEWVESESESREKLATLFALTGRHFTLRLSERERVARNISEVLYSPQTPAALWEKIAQFVCEATSGDFGDYWLHSRVTVNELLKTLPPDELIGERKGVRREASN